MLSIFSCAWWPSLCVLWENVCLGLLPIFFYCVVVIYIYILSCVNCLYTLDINLLSATLFANIFSHFQGHLFVVNFLCCANAFKFDKIPFKNCFAFTYILLWKTDLGKYCYDLCQRVFHLCSHLGVSCCHVLHLCFYTIRSLFLYMVWGSVLISLFYM